jgi:small subunit ribosomal protein S17
MSEQQASAVADKPAKNTRTLIGKVVSDKRSKTITVLIERRTKHELYGKIVAKVEQVPRARREGRVQAGRRGRDRRDASDLEDQGVGRDPPRPEGDCGLSHRAAPDGRNAGTLWRPPFCFTVRMDT